MRWLIPHTQSSRWTTLALALAGAFFLPGCSVLGLDGHQSTIQIEGPVARSQLNLFYVTCWVVLVVFVLVGSVLAYATFKFRARSSEDENAEPAGQSHGNPLVEVSLIVGAVLALVIIAVPTVKGIFYTNDVPENMKGDAYEVTATGYQWWFKFEYPKEQIAGHGVLTTGNELVIPAGRAVHVNLRSLDVMHSFWVPKLAGKVDMIPNRANYLWMMADKPGYYWGQCAEFCGEAHALMRFRVIALPPKEFYDWLNNQMAPAREVAPSRVASNRPAVEYAALREYAPNESGDTGIYDQGDPLDVWRKQQRVAPDENPVLIARGKALFAEKTCSTCHTIRGYAPAVGIVGPELTHVGARSTLVAGLLDNTPEELRRWIHNPEAVKPGNKMWANGYLANHITLSSDDEVALVAFLESLK